MSIRLLRVILLIQVLIAAFAVSQAYAYLTWENVPNDVILSSPDAYFIIKAALKNWLYFKGISVGLAICMVLIAIAQRTDILAGTWKLRIHWLFLLMPITVVALYGQKI